MTTPTELSNYILKLEDIRAIRDSGYLSIQITGNPGIRGAGSKLVVLPLPLVDEVLDLAEKWLREEISAGVMEFLPDEYK